MPKKLCTYGGCRAIVDDTERGASPRCDKHRVAITKPQKQVKQHQLDELGRYFYRTPEWRAARKRYIAENPFCEHCALYGKVVDADVVDHVIELEDLTEENQYLRLDPSNFKSLCHHCHNIKSAEQARIRRLKQQEIKRLNF